MTATITGRLPSTGVGRITYRTMGDMAHAMGVTTSCARRWLLKAEKELNIQHREVRTADTLWQRTLAWAEEDAERLLQHRQARGFPVGGQRHLGEWQGVVRRDPTR